MKTINFLTRVFYSIFKSSKIEPSKIEELLNEKKVESVESVSVEIFEPNEHEAFMLEIEQLRIDWRGMDDSIETVTSNLSKKEVSDKKDEFVRRLIALGNLSKEDHLKWITICYKTDNSKEITKVLLRLNCEYLAWASWLEDLGTGDFEKIPAFLETGFYKLSKEFEKMASNEHPSGRIGKRLVNKVVS